MKIERPSPLLPLAMPAGRGGRAARVWVPCVEDSEAPGGQWIAAFLFSDSQIQP